MIPSSSGQLALARDVTAFESPFLKDPARMISTALDLLKEKGLVTSGQPVIIQGDSLQGELLADSIIFNAYRMSLGTFQISTERPDYLRPHPFSALLLDR